MPFGNSDEDVPYRSHVPDGITSDDSPTVDEDNFDTLKAVYISFQEAIAALDKWHAFDLEEKDELSLKQQIVAHRLAYDIIAPLYSELRNTVSSINAKYRDR